MMSSKWPATATTEHKTLIMGYTHILRRFTLFDTISAAFREGGQAQEHEVPLSRTVVQEATGRLMAHFSTAFFDTLLHSFY